MLFFRPASFCAHSRPLLQDLRQRQSCCSGKNFLCFHKRVLHFHHSAHRRAIFGTIALFLIIAPQKYCKRIYAFMNRKNLKCKNCRFQILDGRNPCEYCVVQILERFSDRQFFDLPGLRTPLKFWGVGIRGFIGFPKTG